MSSTAAWAPLPMLTLDELSSSPLLLPLCGARPDSSRRSANVDDRLCCKEDALPDGGCATASSEEAADPKLARG
jgi:hypothetical protein